MPTFSLVEIAKVAFKLALIAILTALLVGYVSSLINTLLGLFNHLLEGFIPLDGLDLGWFANEIGMVDFLNSLMNSLFFASTIFISALIVVLSFKFGFKAYSTLKSV